MSAPTYADVKALFVELEGLPREERAARLAAASPTLRAEVEALLDANSALDDGFMEPVLHMTDLMNDDPLLGTRIGAFRVERVIGEGGMGRVYAASRDDGAFEQTVALKVVKRGMDTEAVLRRFEAERRILARLRHPGIARLIDGGETEDGRPYVAMELVDGDPLTAYADRFSLGVEDRVRLLAQVCDAVAHAHRRLVVHRDLKPSNVLVETDAEGTPTVKLLDFGIARVLEGDPDDALTVTGQRPMTRPYAAPEQVRGEEVTTATDTWALGVLLYQLLTGERPFRADSRAGLESAILDHAPTLPSAAASRGETTTGGPSLARRLRGDLDAVCLTALAKEPERRYPTADAFAADLRRFLSDLPVEARPPAASYRVRKFVRRHRSAVTVALAALAVLVAGAGVYTVHLQAERDRASLAAQKADRVALFLKNLLSDASPYTTPIESRTVLEVLDASVAQIDTGLVGEPAVQGELLRTVGDVYASLGRNEEAERALSLAMDRFHEAGDSDPLGLSRAGVVLGRIYIFSGRAAESDSVLTLAIEEFGAPEDLEVDDKVALMIAHTTRASANHWQQDLDASIADYEASLALADELGSYVESQRLETLSGFTFALADAREYERALALSEEVVAETRRLYPDNEVRVIHAEKGITRTLMRQGRFADAEPYLRRGLAVRERVLGPDNPEVAIDRADLARTLLAQGETREADSLLTLALPGYRAAYGEDSPYVASIFRDMGASALAAGDLAAAAEAYQRAVAQSEPHAEAFPGPFLEGVAGWAEALDLAGAPAGALRRLRQSHGDEALAENAYARSILGAALAQTGDTSAGLRHARAAVDSLRASKGEASWETARARLHLGRALRAAGRSADARSHLQASGRALREARGPRSAYVAAARG
ncbi:MAG TPA: serine/threonine protein kinase [Bacteroidetes bacterium]|nr:serine/threonine protein kinase [Bacteroidota bacterium]